MIENIISVKTFTPDLPGNFSGGLLSINTKTLPDKFNMSFGVSTGYNSQSSLVDNFNSHPDKGKYDWLGFDDGSRNQPALLLDPAIREQLSSSTYLTARQPGNDEVRSIFHESSRAFNNSFVPSQESAPVNMGLNFSIGDRLGLFGRDFGYTVSLNYASNYQHYDDGIESTFINTNTDFLFEYQDLQESKSVRNPSMGGLLNFGYKLSDNHLLSGNVIFNNDAEIIGRSQSGGFLGQVSNSMAVFNTHSLEFIQRQLTSYQLGGQHVFPGLKNIRVDWNGAITRSFQKEPDLRYFAYTSVTEDNGGEMLTEYYLNNAEYAFPYHFFRELNDEGFEGKVDVTIPFLTGSQEGSPNIIKVGGLYQQMDREFDEYRYQLNNSGVPSSHNFTLFNGDFDAFWDPQNFGIIDTLYKTDGSPQRYVTGYHYINQINARNFYTGESKIAAAYAMAVYQLTERLKVIGGVRVEKTDMRVISEDPTVEEGKLDLTDYLFSVNLVYALNESSNLRLAASRTLARPNMRELAPFVQFDTKNGFFNVGNPDLKRTLIHNYDLRYELYPRTGELLAISLFYKSFKDPIIRAFNPRATIPELSFINVDEAMVLGAELELRKKLDFISHRLSNFYFSTNVAIIGSTYDIPADEIQNSKNIDPEYDETTRPFQGQAPYIVNAGLAYINPDAGWEASLSFNVSGERLYNISLFATPDVYEQPFPLLNLRLAKQFADHFQLSFTAKNILDSINKKTLDFNGKEYIAEAYSVGTTLGIGLSYSIK
jgi:TonB-dependent receptor